MSKIASYARNNIGFDTNVRKSGYQTLSAKPGHFPPLARFTVSNPPIVYPRSISRRIQKPLSSTDSTETTFSRTTQRDLWFLMTLSFALCFSFFYVLDVICAFAFAYEVKKIERTECLEAFLANKCNDPVPFARDECIKMDLCLRRSITNVGYGRLAVESLASMVNGFFEPISLKALVRSELYLDRRWN
ncbi:hypothetical protein F5879DRAFT_993712 [Lentinula edodes]|uniref:uncharacterized protein n=1 Tax=Lentinula edodes TaxID=5353 RepID=UPI001E8DDB30|nr:uncharacterized protein C8R40DRAFT_1176258 [Lentinula edodes]KAH7869934.1 hypothetical protein C8R40DRAFT_1176258 [Lentinula edodes]KAJ3899530.1 hypothetical protein F5879DRAFT_993712 [Lentinula edodes]